MCGRLPRGAEGGSGLLGGALGFPRRHSARPGRSGGRGLGSLETALARLWALLEDEGWHPLLVSTAGSKQPEGHVA